MILQTGRLEEGIFIQFKNLVLWAWSEIIGFA
jgi:hypothetical protein